MKMDAEAFDRAFQERRFQRYSVPMMIIETVLRQPQPGSIYLFPKFPALPEDARILDVCFVWEARSFQICVCHDSFPAVPEGDITPMAPGSLNIEWESYELLEKVDEATIRFQRGNTWEDQVDEAIGVPPRA
jgi:hypothetical protein